MVWGFVIVIDLLSGATSGSMANHWHGSEKASTIFIDVAKIFV
jgi:hypothetical protein